jgi:hypothetical protein
MDGKPSSHIDCAVSSFNIMRIARRRGRGRALRVPFRFGGHLHRFRVWVADRMSAMRCVQRSTLARHSVPIRHGLPVLGAGSDVRSVFDQRRFAGYCIYASFVAHVGDAVQMGAVYCLFEPAESDEDDVAGIQDQRLYASRDVFVCFIRLREYDADVDGQLKGIAGFGSRIADWQMSIAHFRACRIRVFAKSKLSKLLNCIRCFMYYNRNTDIKYRRRT